MKLIPTHWNRLWLCYKFLCSIFSKDTKPFDFIKRNGLRKLDHKGKFISQINGGSIMLSGNLRRRFYKKISWLDCEQCGGKNQCSKG